MCSAEHKGLLVYCVRRQRINATGKLKISFPVFFLFEGVTKKKKPAAGTSKPMKSYIISKESNFKQTILSTLTI